jgi:glutamate decarboxylase
VLNPHKLLGTPLQCSFILASDRQIFKKTNSLGAQYLFHDDSKYDLGDGTVGCGRRPDAIKLFIGWKIYGITGYKKRLEHAFNMAKYLTNLVKNNNKFKMVLEDPPNLQICFWYIPKGMKILDREEKVTEKKYQAWKEQMTLVTKEIHKRIRERGRFLFDYSPLKLNGKELPPFFRVVINAPSINEYYLDELVKEVERAGEGVLEYLEENKNLQNGLGSENHYTNGNYNMNGNGYVNQNGVYGKTGIANGKSTNNNETNGFHHS